MGLVNSKFEGHWEIFAERKVKLLFSPGGGKGQTYPFGIMGMANKSDCLQKGELVKFQVCTVTQTGQKMACNVVPQRRAMVECVKDQVMLRPHQFDHIHLIKVQLMMQ